MGGFHRGTYGQAFDLKVVTEGEGEVVVGEDKLDELDKELSRCKGMCLYVGGIKEMFQGREAMGVGDVGI